MWRAVFRPMQDPRWSQLKARLLDDGWVWRDDTLYAPHQTMWFQTSSENPHFAQFRDRMTIACDATSGNIDLDIDQNASSGTAGIEYQVFVVPARGQADVVKTIKPYVTVLGTIPDVLTGIVPVSCVADGCDVSIPRRLLGDDDGRFDFRVRIYAKPTEATVLDLLPDIGMVRVQ